MAGCAGLRLTLVEAAHQQPSNVAMFFTVDTRDGEPLAGLTAADFRIYEDGQLVSPDESKQTIVNREVAAEHYTLLLVDMSGSVTESDDVPLIVGAAREFASSLEGYQQVAVYAFDGSEDIHRIQPFARSASGIDRLGSFRARDPSTNLHGAVVKATQELDAALERSRAQLRFGTIVVFTDGTDRASRMSLSDARGALDDSGYDVFAIGVGNEIDEGTLSRIGYNGYVLVQDSSAVAQAFQAVSERILGYTRRFYLLSYCSPARAGRHEVTVEAVGPEGDTGSVSYAFDAEGFGPNCNPERPPPFDTSGGRIHRASQSGRTGVRIEIRATVGTGGAPPPPPNPELGDL